MVNADPLTWVAKVCVVKSYLIRQMSVEHGQMSYTQGVAGAVVVLDWTIYELLLLELPPHDRLTEKMKKAQIIYRISSPFSCYHLSIILVIQSLA